MDILLIILAMVALYGLRFSAAGHPDYICRQQTDAIKGIFAIIILFAHMHGYLPEAGEHDRIFYAAIESIGQLMVVMFMLYSGYGVMESLKRDREQYYRNFLSHRVLKVWLMFAIAVTLFLLLSIALGQTYETDEYIWCWIGWKSIGNSNWFVFDILALYLLTYLALTVANRLKLDLKKCALYVFVLVICFSFVLRAAVNDAYWYDTIVAYPVGMFFSLYRKEIERLSRGWRWLIWFGGCVAIFTIITKIINSYILTYSNPQKLLNHLLFISASSFFALALVFATMKLKFDNKALRWLGANAFAIYVLQRLAMIVCAHFGLHQNPLLFSAIVIPATLLIASIFTATTDRLNQRILKK